MSLNIRRLLDSIQSQGKDFTNCSGNSKNQLYRKIHLCLLEYNSDSGFSKDRNCPLFTQSVTTAVSPAQYVQVSCLHDWGKEEQHLKMPCWSHRKHLCKQLSAADDPVSLPESSQRSHHSPPPPTCLVVTTLAIGCL